MPAPRCNLTLSLVRRIVLLDYFVNREDAIGLVIVLHQDGDIGNTMNFVPVIPQDVADPIAHVVLMRARSCSGDRSVEKLILPAWPTSTKLRNIPSNKRF